MKKLAISLSLMYTFALSYLSASTNNTTADYLKERLYERQKSILPYTTYMKFIEPYIQEASDSLKIPGHCQTHKTLERDYCDALCAYSAAQFNYYCTRAFIFRPYQLTWLQYTEKNLLQAIQAIEQRAIIPGLDAKQEFIATKQLIYKANKAYSKKVGILARTLWWLTSCSE